MYIFSIYCHPSSAVDYDKNGFNSENASVPGYVGDLAVSPYPVEGTR
jgi:hypothetical protein